MAHALTLEQFIARITAGEPVTWLTVQQGDEIFDIVVADGHAPPGSARRA
jgi:hypothetical protein